MASILRVNTLTDASSGNSTAMSTINQGTAKAWINFNGSGTIAERDSFNNASITDNGTGDYTVTITSAMANVNYAHVGAAGQGNTALLCLCQNFDLAAPTTTVSRYQTPYVNGVMLDATSVNVALHGDLA
jgi:hypothetical protein